jgi:serine protein kinase
LVYVDTVIVAHSNEAEWQKFKADHTNEAILDRIVAVRVPYNLRLSEEVKIYQKIIRNSDFRAHVAPHTLEVASMFADPVAPGADQQMRSHDQAQTL